MTIENKTQPRRPGLFAFVLVGSLAAVGLFAIACVLFVIARIGAGSRGDYTVRIAPGSVQCEASAGTYAVHVGGLVLNEGKGTPSVIEVILIATQADKEVARESTWVNDSGIGEGETRLFDGYVAVDGKPWDGCKARIGTVR